MCSQNLQCLLSLVLVLCTSVRSLALPFTVLPNSSYEQQEDPHRCSAISTEPVQSLNSLVAFTAFTPVCPYLSCAEEPSTGHSTPVCSHLP